MIDAEKYQPARQNMKFVTRSLRSLANNFIFWLDRLIFSVSINSHPDNIYLLRLFFLFDIKSELYCCWFRLAANSDICQTALDKYLLDFCIALILCWTEHSNMPIGKHLIVEEASTATSFLQSDLSQPQVCAQLSVHAVIGHSRQVTD